ncbi:MAG: 16S rRNA (uracil(1498)-N(3))-methyltransferase [Euryarchaeota archaeon TMED85]|nr:MAG: 16S rRNA (uracil(1498)-N(3))-methyltransferase [Euryarchaeota archaeon TMED85]
MFRIYYPKKLDEYIEISDNKSHKISSVLRMKKGEKINIFDGKGNSQIMEIEELSKDKISLRRIYSIVKKQKKQPEIILAISLVKLSRFEIAVEKTSELGVSKIIPLITENTNDIFVKRINDNRLDRMKNISISASEQCGNDFISEIKSPLTLEQIMSLNDEDTGLVLFYENLKEMKNNSIDIKKFKKIIVLIGPEGGFSDEEFQNLQNKSIVLSLGEHILRTETAAICAIHEINSLLRITP